MTECPPEASCRMENGQPVCRCRDTCPMDMAHVCGTDGNTYLNLCHLRRAACLNQTSIVVQYPGRCDPCAGVPCPAGEVCLVSEGRVARCSCPEHCPLDHAPVCASDGRTFNNECELRADACRTRTKLRVQYRGPCDQGLNPCSELKCEFGAKCEVNEKGRGECVCGPPCEEVMRPVCGSDGVTHQSLCHLKRTACTNRTKIELFHSGICGGAGACREKNCPPPSICVEEGETARCECPACPGDYDPVCGSDGVSYSNHCKLQRQACVHSKQIKILYKGLCNGCENKKCEFYAICQIDGSGDANCVCPANCSEERTTDEEVCGSDGKTYSSECELKQISCLNKVPLHVARRGPCGDTDEECPMDCSGAAVEQVCGSDLVTYPSQCELLKRACEIKSSGIRLEVLFYGSCQHRGPIYSKNTTPLPGGADPEEACRGVRCQFSATCELDPAGYPRCACRFACPSGGQPVCGSDFVLYQNKCEMEAAACSKQIEIRVRPLDLCKGMEVKPCGGDPPLVDPVTGEEMDCGNGHNRQDCPSDYYCHQTPQFAKCCRKESGIYLKDCSDSWYGCCPDGKTPAQGVDQEGCPSMCGCNKIGSYSDWCDKESGACECRPGVGGPKCDRCEPGYWGLPKISSGYKGCLPCGCSLFGSVREDCEQMTGRCVCKPGVSGHKCDTCPVQGQILTPAGCTMADVTTPVPTSCSQLICYFGAVCEERGGRASCVCTATCPNPDKQQIVCGSDGQTYGSECQLKLYACKYQKDIAVQSLGACKEESISGTEGPVRRWTSYSQYTLPDDIASPLSKSTRHLLTEKYNLPGKSRDVYIVEGHATSVGVELGAGLGQACSYDIDCTVGSSVCKAGSCVCKAGHVESQGLCIPEESPSFTGQSWMRLRKLKAYHKFSLELEFLSYNEDGILFYTQQHQDGTGDFISLALVNGHVVLNYNLGSGTVSVPSLGRVSLGVWHSVKVRRYQRDALLQVDSEQGVRGQSQGTLTGLDLDDHAYLGYVPTNFSKVFQNAGTQLGLVGCMRWGGVAPEESHMIGSACLHNPCRGIVCQNHGSCIPLSPRPICACQSDFTGKHCEEKLNPCVYSVCVGGTECIPIEGGGFDCVCTSREAPCAAAEESEPAEIGPQPLILPRLEGVSRALALSMSFATISTEGTLLYNGQGHHNKGDFLSLKLSQGRLVFSFSLGGNPVSIVSKEKIEAGEWHTARVSRLDKEGFLRLDSGRIYRGVSVGQHLELNLDHPLYIGAPPFDAEEWPAFNGAVKSFIVNGHRMPLTGARPCTLSLCSVNTTSSTICEGCGIIENEAIHFDGSTVVKYPKKPLKRNETEFEESEDIYEEEAYEENYTEGEEEDLDEMEDDYEVYDDYTFDYTDERQKRRGGMRIEVSIKSSGPDGALILGKGGQGFWGLVILNNSVRFIAHQVEIASKVIVTDGRWHRISALRRRKSLSLRVDREGLIRASLPPGLRSTTTKYYVGGSPPDGEGLYPGFQGCVRGLRIDGRLVVLEGKSCPVS